MADTHDKCRGLGRVLFIGGNPRQFPSVQIRCEDIASRLGCDRVFSAKKAKEIPREYSVFVCVKANFNQDEILKLSRRGIVIWDVVDNAPPKQGVSIYLTSTEKARQVFKDYGRVIAILVAFLIHKNAGDLGGLARCIGIQNWKTSNMTSTMSDE
jgi:hypothetical protein